MFARNALPVWLSFGLCCGAGAVPPGAPTITEPEFENQILNPSDVHMEALFSDGDGDGHLCSDWQIWTVSPNELVWEANCITGLERVHSHLGDGTFTGSLTGQLVLDFNTEYRLRTRHRDDSPGQEWGPWSERIFLTGPPTAIFPMEADDAAISPSPTWEDAFGDPIGLPTSTVQPRVIVETIGGSILEFVALDGINNQVVNPTALADHGDLRVRITAGDLAGGLILPQSEITFRDDEGIDRTIYLPPASVSAGSDAVYWVASSGASYVGSVGQTSPDFSTLAQGVPVPWAALQPGFKVEVVASGFRLPVNIAFVPNPGPNGSDPAFYVTELYGSIKVVTNDGTVSDYATNLLNYVPTGNFPGSGEQGVTGVAVHPATGDVYAVMLYDAGGPHYPKVVRFTSNDGGLTAATETAILMMPGESQGQSHQISNVTFGPDGLLYVHNGDGFDAGTGQDINSFRGKILRMNLDGTAPSDNPMFNAGNGINSQDYIYSYGLRNPFGGAWRDADGAHYQVENGPSIDRFAKVNVGQNFLWDGSNASMNSFALLTWNPATGPTNIAFIQNSEFGGSLFPASKLDHAFIAESGPTWATGPQSRGKRIREYVLDASGNLMSGPTDFVNYIGTGKATVIGLASGPDGLYFTDFYRDQDYTSPVDGGANVLRVKFVGAAAFSADVTAGDSPLTVQFTDESTVPNATDYLWSFGDGSTSTDQNPSHTYTADGIYDVRLSVTGPTGLQVTQQNGFVRVGQLPSVALIGEAGTGSTPTGADQAVIDHLSASGFDMTLYDDNNRPSAAAIAAAHDLVLVSSTTLSSNVAGDFRNEDIALITWESALMRQDRVPLADAGAVVGGQTTITVVDDSHPVTAGLGLGDVNIFSAGSNMSVARAPFAANATQLAHRAGATGDAAVVVAEAGVPLLGGHVPLGRRIYLCLEDSSFFNATSAGQQLLDQSVCWALGFSEPVFALEPAAVIVPRGSDVTLSSLAQGGAPMGYRWRRNGLLVPNGNAPDLTLTDVQPADAGLYDVEASNPCGVTISASAMLTVTCQADLNLDLTVDVFDLLAYLALWFVQDPGAELTDDATIDVFDLLAYLDVWFVESGGACP